MCLAQELRIIHCDYVAMFYKVFDQVFRRTLLGVREDAKHVMSLLYEDCDKDNSLLGEFVDSAPLRQWQRTLLSICVSRTLRLISFAVSYIPAVSYNVVQACTGQIIAGWESPQWHDSHAAATLLAALQINVKHCSEFDIPLFQPAAPAEAHSAQQAGPARISKQQPASVMEALSRG